MCLYYSVAFFDPCKSNEIPNTLPTNTEKFAACRSLSVGVVSLYIFNPWNSFGLTDCNKTVARRGG